MKAPYYQDDSVTIYHGDSEELLPQMSADAILTDPPYGVGIKYGSEYDDSRKDYWPWFAQMVVTMRGSAPVIAFTHRVAALHYITDWDWVGVWKKPYASGARIGNSPILPHWEPVFLYGIHTLGVVPGQHVSDVFEVSPKKAGNVGGIGREKWAKGDMGEHPCPKPDALCNRFMFAFTQPGETVLDPFLGSGTTLRAAKALGRKAIGIDIHERFCEQAARLLSQEVFDLGDAA